MDLISSEYGWSDDQILDLTLARLRQITTAIQQRRYLEHRQERLIASWQTRTLAQFVALTIPVEGKNNPLLDAAATLDIDGDLTLEDTKEDNLPSYEQMLAFGQAMERGPSYK